MTNENIVKEFAKKGFLLDKETAEFFLRINDKNVSEQILNKIQSIVQSRIISKKIFTANINQLKPELLGLEQDKLMEVYNFFNISLLQETNPKTIEAKPEKKVDTQVKILSTNIIPYKKIEVKDFVNHFRNRYNLMKDLLKDRSELSGLISINKIENNRNFSIIGMVSNKRTTKNKNIILEIEDLTGRNSALISQEKEELMKKANEIMMDDVIGLKCSGSREFLYVNDIIFPDSYVSEKRKSDNECYALFISDIHIGSKFFLEKSFQKFLNWLNGEGIDNTAKERIKKIKYLFIAGDNVDGVGVYPSQESLLNINDIKEQYKRLLFYLNQVPKHINIIMCPGQHDAVRVPEPQPPIDEEFGGELTNMNNLFLVSNPSLIEIESEKKRGIKVLMYHGASMHHWIDEIDELRTGQANLYPSRIVKYMLKHRHLSPTHGGNIYVPSEKEDALAIKEIPDIIFTGDMHRTDVDIYNNILIICGSCWQSITPFEEKVGNFPDPCKVPMLNLKTREIKILDFTEQEEEKK